MGIQLDNGFCQFGGFRPVVGDVKGGELESGDGVFEEIENFSMSGIIEPGKRFIETE